ncbi:MAG TPA: hypothetical protein VJ725_34610 [Thermoanaerobaculia bacterium]|nr:hypothetical protein [Thermoanaerobaculia bacterium]
MDGRQGSPDRFDERLREALEPRPETAARIARAALSGERPVRSGPPRLAAAAVMSALLAMAALLVWPLRPPAPPESGEAAFKIENAGDVLIVRSSEGGGWLLRSGETERGSSSGILIVTYGGER